MSFWQGRRESLFRPAEVDHLVGNASKAKAKLGWTPKVSFPDLIAMMVDHDIYRLEKGLSPYAAVEVARA